MFFGGGIFGLLMLVAWVWGLYDVATTPASEVRNLPKVGWFLVVLVLSFLGVLAWLALGRPHGAPFPGGGLRRGGEDARDEAGHLSDRERRELERREYYKRMDEELDRRLEEKRRHEQGPEH